MIDGKFTLLLLALACAAQRANAPAPPPGDAPTVAAAAASPASPPAPDTGEGWRGARWGMTVDEVLKAFPGEAVRIDPEMRLADGTVVAAGIDAHQVASRPFRVRFVFQDGKLSLVSLRTPPDSYAGHEVFAEVEKALAARYGPPMESASDAELIDLRQTRWSAGTSGVDLKYIPGVVAIVHYPRPAAARGR